MYSSMMSSVCVFPPSEVDGNLLISTQRTAPGDVAGLVFEGGIGFCLSLAAMQDTQGP